ncbi:MAG: response regulator transcription factor [Burkholderiales bacterium]|nr:response regulator transcription factor [Burkholderiales bacterium]
MSLKTIEKHRSNLMAKLDLRNAAGPTAHAMEQKLIVEYHLVHRVDAGHAAIGPMCRGRTSTSPRRGNANGRRSNGIG